MAGPAFTTDAIVLLKRAPAENFQSFTLFSAEQGMLRVMQRAARKPGAGSPALDLFDEASVTLEGGQSGTWFVKEALIQVRHAGIGRSYENLQLACAFTGLIARNPVHEESRASVYQLLRTACAAFEAAARPDVVFFKSLYCFARDEGHPLKQQWFPTLPADDRAAVTTLLNRPVAEVATPPAAVSRLRARLEEFLRGHTEILID